MAPKTEYPLGDVRAVLRQRFSGYVERGPDRIRRQRAARIIAAIDAGKPVTVTSAELGSALWHAGLINGREKTAIHNAGHAEYVVASDGSYEPA